MLRCNAAANSDNYVDRPSGSATARGDSAGFLISDVDGGGERGRVREALNVEICDGGIVRDCDGGWEASGCSRCSDAEAFRRNSVFDHADARYPVSFGRKTLRQNISRLPSSFERSFAVIARTDTEVMVLETVENTVVVYSMIQSMKGVPMHCT